LSTSIMTMEKLILRVGNFNPPLLGNFNPPLLGIFNPPLTCYDDENQITVHLSVFNFNQ